MSILIVRPSCSICASNALEEWRVPRDVAVWRCRSCGARSTVRAPSAALLRERYDEEHRSGKWKIVLERTLEVEIERRALLTTRLAGRSGPGRLLDVGFGDGRFLDAVKRLGWKTTGTEIAHSAASLGAAMHARIVGELEALKEGPLFDVITFFDVLEHLPKPAHALRQARARLRQNGLVVVTMPNLWGTTSVLAGPYWPYYDFAAYGHIHHLAPRHIRMLVRRAGFEPMYEETRGSVNLRDLPTLYGLAAPSAAAAWALDKASGLLSRVAEPLRFGNTLFTAARTANGGSNVTPRERAGTRAEETW
jgi:2-polyprenyl-3-methyl-5-hydroxy-6-metoxy-1,4-benzoquinol methylase